MAASFMRHSFEDGEVIFRKGDAGDCLYLIEKGGVEIWVEEGGDRRILGRLGLNEMFGEMAVFDRQPRMANASAQGRTVVLQMPPTVLRQAMNQCDPLIARLVEALVKRLRAAGNPEV